VLGLAQMELARKIGTTQPVVAPVTVGSVHYAGIKIHDTRILRLFEVLLHGRVMS
jgi:predicted transcriptional regulator